MRRSTLAALLTVVVAAAMPLRAAAGQLPSVTLPAQLDRVLRDYERAWRSGDAPALAALFSVDGFVLPNGRAPVRGRDAITRAYTGQAGGDLRLRALAYAAADTIGYIIGAYGYGDTQGDIGKFTLTLRRTPGGPWEIFSDMDNGNQPRRPTSSTPSGAPIAATSAPSCASPADWSTPRAPTRIYGNTWYVGTQCIAAILVTSDDGHMLIDAGVPQAVPHVRASIERLGFKLADVKLILNSHAHYDHAGGIAELQRASGATVAASPASAAVLEAGASGPDDPQYGVIEAFPAVASVRVLADSEVVRVGSLALTAHWTPGHTRGGTSWSWRSCEASRCLDIVYADSQTPVSADNFFYTRSATYPNAIADFRRGHARLEALRCDILLTPHPGASALWQRISANGTGPALVDPDGCRTYAARGRASLAARIAREAGAP